MSNLGKCPKCGSPDGLFICSFMAVNCADCMQYIRRATKEEIQEIIDIIKLLESAPHPPPGSEETSK